VGVVDEKYHLAQAFLDELEEFAIAALAIAIRFLAKVGFVA
jgi:hypothetical protein